MQIAISWLEENFICKSKFEDFNGTVGSFVESIKLEKGDEENYLFKSVE